MTAMLDVRPEAFGKAARALGDDVAVVVTVVGGELVDALAGSAGMAGSDDVGTSWGNAYDDVAAQALSSAEHLAAACYRLAALLEQTGINYAGAEAASVPGDPAEVAETRYAGQAMPSIGRPPSSIGSGVPEPSGWSLVASVVGMLWPNGHQDLLRAAGAAWRDAGSRIAAVVGDFSSPLLFLLDEHTPEAGNAWTLVSSLQDQVGELAAAYDAIADACDDYAGHLDAAHSQVISELESFIEWTVAIESIGFGLTLLTAGMSDLAAQSAEGVELGRVASAIVRIIEALRGLAGAVAWRLTSVGMRFGNVETAVAPMLARAVYVARVRAASVAGDLPIGRPLAVQTETDVELAGVAGTRLGKAMNQLEKSEEAVAEDEIAGTIGAHITVSRKQLEEKFSHATAFGVTEARGVRGFKAFEQRLREFVAAPSTETIEGTYRGEKVYLSFDRTTDLVVIRDLDGTFRSGWRMNARQQGYVYTKGSLGGS